MTSPQSSQSGIVSVIESVSVPLRSSQFGIISVQADAPLSTPSNASQLGMLIVVANNKTILPLSPVIGLGCWSPCGTLAHNYYRRD